MYLNDLKSFDSIFVLNRHCDLDCIPSSHELSTIHLPPYTSLLYLPLYQTVLLYPSFIVRSYIPLSLYRSSFVPFFLTPFSSGLSTSSFIRFLFASSSLFLPTLSLHWSFLFFLLKPLFFIRFFHRILFSIFKRIYI